MHSTEPPVSCGRQTLNQQLAWNSNFQTSHYVNPGGGISGPGALFFGAWQAVLTCTLSHVSVRPLEKLYNGVKACLSSWHPQKGTASVSPTVSRGHGCCPSTLSSTCSSIGWHTWSIYIKLTVLESLLQALHEIKIAWSLVIVTDLHAALRDATDCTSAWKLQILSTECLVICLCHKISQISGWHCSFSGCQACQKRPLPFQDDRAVPNMGVHAVTDTESLWKARRELLTPKYCQLNPLQCVTNTLRSIGENSDKNR